MYKMNILHIKYTVMKISYVKLLFVALFAFIAVSCNNDDDNSGSQSQIATTQPEQYSLYAQDAPPYHIKFKGVVSDAASTLYITGVCWSESPNPVATSAHAEITYEQLGEFGIDVTDQLKPGTVYHIRAYAKDYDENKPVIYGEDITYTSPAAFTVQAGMATLNSIQVNFTKAIEYQFDSYAVVYSTTPNPTVNDNLQEAVFNGAGGAILQGLESNTTYYAKVAGYKQGQVFYSDELVLSTAGATGPGGGIVVIDKGPNAQDYRYVEIYIQGLTYDTALGEGAHWGMPTVALTELSDNPDAGPANTAAIVAAVSEPNCAAKLCANFTNNGYDDWYLSSPYELYQINNNLQAMDIYLSERVWTSKAFGDIMTTNQATSMQTFVFTSFQFQNYNVNSNAGVYPVRRYN